ncbi:MAG: cytochrome ubiquinol oxidase subunit I [Chloroflexi bacterium]|nr:cytochrome ubiquinol oxidase subunit I [Chloroflexota bacterium]
MEPSLVPDLVRRLSMALLMLFHLQFAAFIIGVFGLAVVMEFLGLLSPARPYFDRLAHGLARTSVILYSTGAVLAIIFMLVITLFWPTFWYIVIRIAFWPMVLEAIAFVLTILYLFPWYYTWDRLAGFKGAHLAMGVALVAVVNAQQAMIDVMAGYMLTPTPPTDLLRVFFNASTLPLDMHRVVGDVSFAGFVVGGYAALRALRSRDEERRRYYDWMGNAGLIAGLGFLFLQPAIGLAYVEEIRANSPGAFTAMMRGRLSWTFLVQVSFLSALFFLSALYMALQVRKSGERGVRMLTVLLVVVGLSGLLLMQPYVVGPSQGYQWINGINPIGTMQPWKYIAFGGMTLGALGALYAYMGSLRHGLRWGHLGPAGRGAQYILLMLAVVGSLMMLTMGFIRENSRQPFLIYYELRWDQPESYPTLQPTPTSQGQGSSGQAAR